MLSPSERPSWDAYFLAQAVLAATRSTCARRAVGVVFVSADNRPLSTGYNGTAPGAPHCIDEPCAGACLPSGQGLELCESSHAEISGLAFLADPRAVLSVYCTTAPCNNCVTALLLTSARRIVFIDDYPGSDESRRRWERAGREWLHKGDVWQDVVHMMLHRQQLTQERRAAALSKSSACPSCAPAGSTT